MMNMIMPALAAATAPATASTTSDAPSAGSSGSAGAGDFLTVLAALVPETLVDASEAESAVAEALVGLAHIGEGDPGELEPDGWQVAALLARFVDTVVTDTGDAASGTTAGEVDGSDTAHADTSIETAEQRSGTSEVVVDQAGAHAEAEGAGRLDGMLATAVDDRAGASDDGSIATPAGGPGDSDADPAVDQTSQGRHGVPGRAADAGKAAGAPGTAVAEAARTSAAERQAAARAAAGQASDESSSAVGRTAAAATASGGPDGADGMRMGGSLPAEVNAPHLTMVREGAERSFTSSAASIQRVLDAVELLENAPPPRQLTLDLGESRLRVAIEDGQVRLTLLGDDAEDASSLLEDARAALEERGFDLGHGSGDGQDGRAGDDRDRHEHRSARPRTAPRPAAAGLRL